MALQVTGASMVFSTIRFSFRRKCFLVSSKMVPGFVESVSGSV